MLPVTGVTALANAIPDMGAISSVNLLENNINIEQAQALMIILKEHPALKSLCGNKGDESELDMRRKMSGAGDVIMLATEVVDNRALAKLDISGNIIEKSEALEQITAICSAQSIEFTVAGFGE
jgi:hypothetical protein